MIQGIYSATAGMLNQQIMLDVITNNLANVSTPGYKRDEVSFSNTLNTLPNPDTYVDTPSNTVNLDTVSAKFATDFSQSGMRRSDNPLDVALDGDGFFVIQHTDGIRYTRSGNFSLDGSGQIVTADGFPVLGVNGAIQLPTTQGSRLEIDNAGQIIADGFPIAQLRLADFQNTNDLTKAGYNTFVASNAAAELPATAEVKQGFLELSNVNSVYEMAKMIEAMRVYESYQKTIQSLNDTMETANKQLGKVSI